MGIIDEIVTLPEMARDRGLQERIESCKIAISSKSELKNMILILMGSALVNRQKVVFETTVAIIMKDIEDIYPVVYEEAIVRTDG